MFCKFCGEKNSDEAKFCANCGKNIAKIVNVDNSNNNNVNVDNYNNNNVNVENNSNNNVENNSQKFIEVKFNGKLQKIAINSEKTSSEEIKPQELNQQELNRQEIKPQELNRQEIKPQEPFIEEPILKCKTEISSKLFMEIINVQFKTILPILLIFSGMLLLIGILSIVASSNSTSTNTNALASEIFLIVSSLAYIPLVYLLATLIQKSNNKTNKMLLYCPQVEYTFYQNYYKENIYKQPQIETESLISYGLIYKAIVTDKYFFIYLSRAQVCVLPIKDIEDNDYKTLANILFSVLNSNFKVKTKKLHI